MIKKLSASILHNLFFLITMSCFTAYSFIFDLSVADLPESGISISVYHLFYKLIETFSQELSNQTLLFTVLSCVFGYFYVVIWYHKKTLPITYSSVLSLFLSIGYLGGISYSTANTITYLFDSDIRLIKSCIFLSGIFMFYLTIINLFYNLCKSNIDIVFKKNYRFLYDLIKAHPWKLFFVIIFFSWLPHLILRYPGVMSYDNYNQLSYYFGVVPYTTAQPIFHTWLFGSFIRLGLLIGSENLGLFFFTVFQSLIMAAVLSLGIRQMILYGVPKWVPIFSLLLYCFGPCFSGYSSFPIKDYLYTGFFVLFFLMLLGYSMEGEQFLLKKSSVLLWILSSLFMILCRNNGIYIYLPIALLLSIFFFKKRKVLRHKQIILLFAILLLPILLNSSIRFVITKQYEVVQDSPKEMFSLPFQQTARFVKEHKEKISVAEAEVLRKVLDYNNLPYLYNEMTSDPVKTTYHAASMEDMTSYFKIWFSQFLQDPLCYLEATWNQNYYIFYPKTDNIVYNKDCYVGHEITIEYGLPALLQFKIPKFMEGITTVMVSYYSLLSKLPVIGLLSNASSYVITFFIISCFIFKDKKRSLYLALLPLLFTFLFLLIGPQIYLQPRYAFPIIYTLPLLLGVYLSKVS